MSNRKGFANQPSRSNQEFVRNTKGEMVRNIAYQGSRSVNSLNQTVDDLMDSIRESFPGGYGLS